MVVTRDDLRRSNERIRGAVEDPRAGIHGPGSVSWKVNREAILFLGGGRAALLQLAHPYVAHAIDQHSDTRNDVHGRFQRTFLDIYAMAFGDLDAALKSSRRVYNIHTKVVGEIAEDVGAFAKGDVYRANDEQALLWVHATLVDTSIQVYELVVQPLRDEEKQRYLDESRPFAWLFGIPDELLWRTWGEFQSYLDRMFASDVLTVSQPARSMAGFLMHPPAGALRPMTHWYEVVTAGLLPERLRTQYGMRFGRRERLVYASSRRALRGAYRLLPRRLRYVPAYVEAVRRVRGRGGRDHFGRLLEALAMRTVGGSFGRSGSGSGSGDGGGCPVHHAV